MCTANCREQFKGSIAKQAKTGMFNKCYDVLLQELPTEQVCQILKASIAVQANAVEQNRNVYVIFNLF